MVNQAQDDVLGGVMTMVEFENWGHDLERDGFTELAREIFERIDSTRLHMEILSLRNQLEQDSDRTARSR